MVAKSNAVVTDANVRDFLANVYHASEEAIVKAMKKPANIDELLKGIQLRSFVGYVSGRIGANEGWDYDDQAWEIHYGESE